jgi:hypothetical protein
MHKHTRYFLIVIAALFVTSVLALSPENGYRPARKIFSSGPALPTEFEKADSLTGFDVQKYEITISAPQSTTTITGNVLATVLAEQALTSLSYNLTSNFTVTSVLVNGSPASFTHSNHIININLNIPAGQTFSTQVFYNGIPTLTPDAYHIGWIRTDSSIFTISDPDAARYWWPCYDHPWDKAIVDLHITMRSDWKVASNGIRTGIVDNGNGTSTTHWIGQHPMTTYLVCVTAANYVEIDQTAGDIPIQSFVRQNQYSNAMVDFANLPEILNYFSQVFGPYPFEKYGQAVATISTYGAMEHQTMTTLGSFIITGNGTYELIIAHELAHQWYGNAVSFLTFKDVWLSEGFATYSEHLWTDKKSGWQAAANYVGSAYHQYYLNWEAGAGPQVIYNPSYMNYFAPPSYEKAASVLHMLRLKIGEANFFQLLNQWFTTYMHGNAITSEFQAMAEQISGQDLDQFFNQWIYQSGIPSLQYSVWSNDNASLPTKVTAKTTSPTATNFHIEVPFRVQHSEGSDSLYVHASPDGYDTYLPQSFDITTATVTPNYNNWALIRQMTELKPLITECLPSNSLVMLSWEAFLNDPTLRYHVFRRSAAAPNSPWFQITTQPVIGLSYTDHEALNGYTYEYTIGALDQQNYLSRLAEYVSATPQAFSFEFDLLVVDETRDGTGANINPNDAMVDDFYAAALNPMPYQQWDCTAQLMPSLQTLGQYRVVLWHADDFSSNLLVDHLNTLGGYIMGGGRVLLSGWKTPSVFSPSFVQRFTGGVELVYDNSAGLISVLSANYPNLTVDPLKLATAWNGMLPQIYTFSGAQNSLYTANMSPTSLGNGLCAGLKYNMPEGGGSLVLLGFPLYFMQEAGVRGFLQQIIPQLLDSTPVLDASVPSALRISMYPNPFRDKLSVDIQMPRAGKISASLYNIRGQHVRTLFDAVKSAGTHSLSMGSQDGNGAPLATGLYFLRVEYEGKILSRRVALIK